MSFGEAKVYFDGSHYIAIPHTTRTSFKKPKPVEEPITIIASDEESTPTTMVDVPSLLEDNSKYEVAENDNTNDLDKLKPKKQN